MRLEDALQHLAALVEPLGPRREHEFLARSWATSDADRHRWRGLALYAADRLTLRLQGSPKNRAHFAAVGTDPKTSRPFMELVALLGLRSHLLADVVISAREVNLGTLELGLVDHSLTIFDETLAEPQLLLRAAESGSERHWIAPVGQGQRLRTARIIDEKSGDSLVELRVPPALQRLTGMSHVVVRAIQYHRHGYPPQNLITSLVDPQAWPRHEITAIHSERWVTHLGGSRVLRGKRIFLGSEEPELIYDRLWAILWAYNLVREELGVCAASLGLEPAQLGFTAAVDRLGKDTLQRAVASASIEPLAALGSVARDLVLGPSESPVRIHVMPGSGPG